MDIPFGSDLLISIIAFSISLSISFRKTKERGQPLLSLFSFLVAVIFLLKHVFVETSTHIWLRICLGLLVPLPLVNLFLISTFLKEENSLSVELYTIQYIFAPIFIVGLSTPIFNNREFVWFVVSYTTGMFSFTFLDLFYIGMRSEDPSLRRRIISFAGLGILSTLFAVLSIKFKTSILFSGASALFIILTLFYMNESISSGRLLDIQSFTSRILVILILSVLISLIYWIFVILIAQGPAEMILNSLAVSIAIALIFDRFREYITTFIGVYLTTRTKDFLARISRLKREISSIIDSEKLVRRVIDEIYTTRKVSNCAFYMLSEDRICYRLLYSSGRSVPERIDNINDHALIDLINQERRAMVKEILERRSVQETASLEGEGARSTLRDVISSFERHNITLIFPIIVENEVAYLLTINDMGLVDTLNAEEIGALLDLSEQISISLENLKVFERMKERDRLAALGEMAAGLAHEIRNPLGAIKGAAQYLNPANLPQEEAEFLKIIIDETDRLNRVLTQFLDYSRPYQGDFTVVNLDETIRQIIKILAVAPDDKYIIEYKNLCPEATVRVDIEHFKQVMINIMKNAREAMPGGGRIEIRVMREEEGGRRILSSAFLRGRTRNNSLLVEIQDHGIGIDEVDLNKVFIPFFTTKKSGTGLGLAISKKIIEYQNGKLEIFSQKGLGTTVRITLPALEAEKSR